MNSSAPIPPINDQELLAYLDEALPAVRMAAIEGVLRGDAELQQRLVQVAGGREAGVHGLGEIWRRHRLSCLTRSQWGAYLLGTLDEAWQSYAEFHLTHIGCRWCAANLEDLQQQHAELATSANSRRQRYFQTTAGLLPRRRP